ncbi:MAG: hypothetical protein IC227_06030 [Enterococcus lacertideformus]|uniref:Uncharacterized protein n=1 Tax=Enterococcus lacertideformus TaxID=2771493 RepID=A0A931F8M0_9ENTE|nr:hypothetical protein [Enterococcus lacertideformus]
MNKFHEAAVYRVRTLQYPETIIDAMERVHKKITQDDVLQEKWNETLNNLNKDSESSDSFDSASSGSFTEAKKEEQQALVSRGITLNSSTENKIELSTDITKPKISDELVLPNEKSKITKSTKNSREILLLNDMINKLEASDGLVLTNEKPEIIQSLKK